jgi:hypothetical protein
VNSVTAGLSRGGCADILSVGVADRQRMEV